VQPDTELETWRRQWQAQDTVPLDLKQRVQREIRMRRLGLLAATIVTATFGLGIPAWAVLSRRMDVAVLACAVWMFIAISWAISWRLGGGASKPVAATTAAFLDFSIESCQRQRRGIAAAGGLYVAMLAFNLAGVYHAEPQGMQPGVWEFLTSRRIAILAAITIVLAVTGVWRRRTLARRLQNLMTFRRQLESSRVP
jgi:hypothetical protein